jgi:hypothetical protein
MANENVEGSAANTMAGSQSGGRGVVKDWIKTVWGNKQLTGGGSSSSSSSGGGGSKGGTGNGWTADDYKNYGDWQERHYGMQDSIEGSRHVRNSETSANNAVLKNASRDAKFIRKNTLEGNRQARDKDTLEHAAKYGQVASIDSVTGKKRNTVRFADTPVRETNPGKGTGAQGTSRQQSKPGGRGASRGPTAYETRHIEDDARNSSDYKGTTRTQAQWSKMDNKSRRDVANSYVTKGDNLTPAQKRQNTAARSYASPYAPGTTAGEAAAADKPTSGVGGSIGGKLGAVAGAAISKSPTGTALGAKAGEALGNYVEKKVVNRKPRAKKA